MTAAGVNMQFQGMAATHARRAGRWRSQCDKGSWAGQATGATRRTDLQLPKACATASPESERLRQ